MKLICYKYLWNIYTVLYVKDMWSFIFVPIWNITINIDGLYKMWLVFLSVWYSNVVSCILRSTLSRTVCFVAKKMQSVLFVTQKWQPVCPSKSQVSRHRCHIKINFNEVDTTQNMKNGNLGKHRKFLLFCSLELQCIAYQLITFLEDPARQGTMHSGTMVYYFPENYSCTK